jgi:hypothetical protein
MDTTTPLTDEQLAAVEQTLHEHLGSGWTQEYVEGDGDEPAYYRVATAAGTVVATVPDWAGSVALFLAEAQDYVPQLLGEIRRLRAQQHMPSRDDAVAAWLKAERDRWEQHRDIEWDALDNLLDEYRLHADTRTPLNEHACSGPFCECDEATGNGA